MAPHLMMVAGPFIFTDRSDGSVAQETNMAKGQKRGNREIRKPKANKPTAAAAASSVLIKGTLTPVSIAKKKS